MDQDRMTRLGGGDYDDDALPVEVPALTPGGAKVQQGCVFVSIVRLKAGVGAEKNCFKLRGRTSGLPCPNSGTRGIHVTTNCTQLQVTVQVTSLLHKY